MNAEELARKFHETYERLAPDFGREASAVPWDSVPVQNKNLMIAVCNEIIGNSTYTYSFFAWPDEKWGHPEELFNLYRVSNARSEMVFTAAEFEMFRSKLSHIGISLREIERIPYHQPESVL